MSQIPLNDERLHYYIKLPKSSTYQSNKETSKLVQKMFKIKEINKQQRWIGYFALT